jgi:hypothetical protein
MMSLLMSVTALMSVLMTCKSMCQVSINNELYHRHCNMYTHMRVLLSCLYSYTQTVPSRFRKEVLAVATDAAHPDAVALEGVQRVLFNIGAANRLSKDEIQSIFQEVGNGHNIPAQSFMRML